MGISKIAIQGGEGSYSHIAADHIFKEDYKLIRNDNFQVCFDQCHKGEADFAVIPFENSTHGSVNENYDLLTKYELYIIKELYLKINFHLIGFPDTKINEIKRLFSHRVSMSQIKDFLEENPKIEPNVYSDNGRAVEHVAQLGEKENVAAASRLAAQIYNLEIIRENIHDNPKNYTRFFVISKNPHFEVDSNKTSIQFGLKHKPGTLVEALKCFSDRGIDLMKIESRPILNTTWEYLFYADLLLGIEDRSMKEAIKELNKSTTDIRILGSYKNGEYIDT